MLYDEQKEGIDEDYDEARKQYWIDKRAPRSASRAQVGPGRRSGSFRQKQKALNDQRILNEQKIRNIGG
jgi:hypothetical protein